MNRSPKGGRSGQNVATNWVCWAEIGWQGKNSKEGVTKMVLYCIVESVTEKVKNGVLLVAAGWGFLDKGLWILLEHKDDTLSWR